MVPADFPSPLVAGVQVQSQLEGWQSRGRGQRAGVDVLSVGRPVQGGLRSTPVDFRQRVLEKLDGRQDLKRISVIRWAWCRSRSGSLQRGVRTQAPTPPAASGAEQEPCPRGSPHRPPSGLTSGSAARIRSGALEPSLTWGKRGLSSLTFFTQSATSLFIALGQFLYSLLRSGEA